MKYIEVLNSSLMTISFSVIYLEVGQKVPVKKDTPLFKMGNYKTIAIPDNCISITLKVRQEKSPGKIVDLLTKGIAKADNRCFEVFGWSDKPGFQEIDCKGLVNLSYFYFRNESKNITKGTFIYTIDKQGYVEKSNNIIPGMGMSFIIPNAATNMQITLSVLEKSGKDIWHDVLVDQIAARPIRRCYSITGQWPNVKSGIIPCPTMTVGSSDIVNELLENRNTNEVMINNKSIDDAINNPIELSCKKYCCKKCYCKRCCYR
ncbi:hypothetical protein [Clostridium tarantellae]|uniref:Uncharacterized protein n=1 Tax=Clostridium tarantellae TaxID=39493 RepID=A0A6I1MJZ7_9CLOT|nr:hypothetical protein [Clostridium tarantellae]MPQ43043.1 hypothetical protein [Clostridium tarantellae]